MKAGELFLRGEVWFGRYQVGGQPHVEINLEVSDRAQAEAKLTEFRRHALTEFRRHALTEHRANLRHELSEVEVELTGGWLGEPIVAGTRLGPLSLGIRPTYEEDVRCAVSMELDNKENEGEFGRPLMSMIVVVGAASNIDRLTREWISSLAELVC